MVSFDRFISEITQGRLKNERLNLQMLDILRKKDYYDKGS